MAMRKVDCLVGQTASQKVSTMDVLMALVKADYCVQ
jgi:hypothetical protein